MIRQRVRHWGSNYTMQCPDRRGWWQIILRVAQHCIDAGPPGHCHHAILLQYSWFSDGALCRRERDGVREPFSRIRAAGGRAISMPCLSPSRQATCDSQDDRGSRIEWCPLQGVPHTMEIQETGRGRWSIIKDAVNPGLRCMRLRWLCVCDTAS